MGNPKGFLQIQRVPPRRRPIEERTRDWREIHSSMQQKELLDQAARCMDCGVPFCNNGCPLGNLIPEWNDLIYQDRWRDAFERLHATNNFPEFTGRLCPAICEDSCVLAPSKNSVTVQNIELNIVENAFKHGWVVPHPPKVETGMRAAVVGSGPSGLACAQQLRRAGHQVTVFERHDRIGGLLTYGIPDFKLEKCVVQRQVQLMESEGVVFRPNINVGANYSVEKLRKDFDAIALCGGATQPRDLPIPGRDLQGTYFAVEYLRMQNRRNAGDVIPDNLFISAKDKRVVILGGGDTGADCLGTAHRQGARTVHQFELLPRPPEERIPQNPWPQWSNIMRSSSAHEEGGIRDYSIQTKSLTGRYGHVEKLHAVRLDWMKDFSGRLTSKEIPNSEFEVEVDLVLLALGFLGPERKGLLDQLGAKMTERGTVWADENKMTDIPGVFAAGDMARGQSLVAWAIAEGRTAARNMDKWMMGETHLPLLNLK
jgi:glutamate synthase (NADPH) small chain